VKPGVLSGPERRGSVDDGRGQLERGPEQWGDRVRVRAIQPPHGGWRIAPRARSARLDVLLFTGATAALVLHAAVDSLFPDAPTGVRGTVIHFFDGALLGAG
jgi:hypothetical protein